MKTSRFILILALLTSLGILMPGRAAVPQQTAGELFEKALYVEEGQGDLQKAIGIYQDLLKRFPDNGAFAAKAQLRIGFCYEKLGMQEARKAFEAVIDKYPSQVDAVKIAREKLALLGRAGAVAGKAGPAPSVRHILTWNDLTINGSISPDEQYISLTDWNTGDLAIRAIATGKERRLTNKGIWDAAHPGYAFESIWSPDSRRVAYSWVNANNQTELHEVAIADPSPRVLCGEEKGVWLGLGEWSLDGKNILAKGISEAVDLRLISAVDGSTRILKTFPDKDLPSGNAFLSPDGKFVAYSCPLKVSDQASDIFLLTIADGREIPLVQHPAHDNLLGWLPDGRGILFASDRSGRIDAWVLPIESGKPTGPPTMVRGNIGTVHPVLMTREGAFYYSTPGAVRTIYSATLDPQTGRLIDPPAKEPLTYEGNNLWPEWSPNGKILAYSSWRELAKRESLLCLYSEGTKELREIRLKESLGHPRWTPDGGHILLQATSMAGGGIYQLDLASEETMLLISKAYLYSMSLRPDQKTLIYGLDNDREKTYRILARDLESGKDTELARTSLTNNTAELSPDGKHLAMLLRTEENLRVLYVMDFPGGSPKEILRFKQGGAFIISLTWSPDGRFVYFSQNPDDDLDWDLWRVPWEGGQGQNLGITMRRFESLSFRPDGRRLTFASIPPDGEFPQVWVMENFLPPVPAAPEKGPEEVRIRKVWDNAIDSFFMGTPSPDGRYLTYVDWQNFTNLGIRDLIKGENRLLTDIKSWETGEMCYYSVFSPDGSRIAYSFQTKDMLNQLRIVNLDGSSTRILHDGQGVTYQTPFGWTADGKRILTVFVGPDRTSRIVSVSAADGSIKVLKEMDLKLARVAPGLSLSPDGRTIAYSYVPRADTPNADIVLLSTDGGREATLIEHPADDNVLGWSPDGGRVFFTSDRTGSIGIWSVRVSDGKPQGMPELVRGDMGNIRSMGMTRDGRLYYGIYMGWSDIFVAPFDPAMGTVLAQPVKAVRKYETFNSAPDWSPDGQFLVCRSSRGKMANEPPALLVRSMRTNEVRELNPIISGGLNFHFLRWSPDGRAVLGVGQDETGKYGALLSIDVHSGKAAIIARSDKDDTIFSPNPAPDGKAIYFIRAGKEFRRVMKLDLESGLEKEIHRTSRGSGIFWSALSPDGRQLALRAEDKIRILSQDGAESRDLVDAKYVSTLAWTGDGKNLLYGKTEEGNQEVVELWRIPATGGEPQKVGLAMSRLMHLRVSPDGKSIAFTASEQPGKTEVWVMENFLGSVKK